MSDGQTEVLQYRIEALEKEVQELRADVRSILKKMDEMSGGKKVLIGVFSVLGALLGAAVTAGGLLLKVFNHGG